MIVAVGPREPRDIAQEILLAILDAELLHGGVVRNPVPEFRLFGGAPKLWRLLQQNHLVAEPAREERGRQSPSAAANDDDVTLEIKATVCGDGRS